MTTAELLALVAVLPAGIRHGAVIPDHADAGWLFAEELMLAPPAARGRQQFVAGRIAAHACMGSLGLPSQPLLRRVDGAPTWPRGMRGSITHKEELCVVLAAASTDVDGLGVDLEPTKPLPRIVWSTVLTPGELARYEGSGKPLDPSLTRLAFVAKEAYAKLLGSPWSKPGFDTLDFHSVAVHTEGSRLRYSSSGPGHQVSDDLRGAYVVGQTWTMAAVWTPPPTTLHREQQRQKSASTDVGEPERLLTR